MELRKVNTQLQERVIKWFNNSWENNSGLDEHLIFQKFLPENLQAEIAINIHMETLARVHIFQDCEPGLLRQLVTRLKLQVFSPSDFVCRKGDIGREMYFIKSGRLSVVSDDGKTIFATLKEGSFFGEISILDIPGNKTGNRRTANVKSVGYSNIFCLTKADLWQALTEYPLARATLLEKGKSLLRKDNLLDEEIAHEREEFEKMNLIIDEDLKKIKIEFDLKKEKSNNLLETFQNDINNFHKKVETLEAKLKDL